MLGELCYQGDYGPVPFGETDIRVMSSSLHAELQRVDDPHEFATAFVSWASKAPEGSRMDLWVAYNAVDWWVATGSLKGMVYERFEGNG